MLQLLRLAVAATMTVLSGNALSMSTTLVCKGDATAGIRNDKDGWKVTKYSPHNFELIVTDKTLEPLSVARVLLWDAQCSNGSKDPENIYCITETGAQLLFSQTSLRGAIANFDLVMHPRYGNDMYIS